MRVEAIILCEHLNELQNHRMVWVGRDLKDHEALTPCCMQGCQPPPLIPAQAAQGPIQPGLEHLQGWVGHPQPLWAAVPAPQHSLCVSVYICVYTGTQNTSVSSASFIQGYSIGLDWCPCD